MTLTIPQARDRLQEISNEHVRLKDRVDAALRRIHEFASSTRDYELAMRGLTMEEIDAEFFQACKRSPDPHAMATRHGVAPETIASWALQAKADGRNVYCRLVVKRGPVTQSYAIHYAEGRETIAKDLLVKFSETLIRHGWEVATLATCGQIESGDTVLADA